MPQFMWLLWRRERILLVEFMGMLRQTHLLQMSKVIRVARLIWALALATAAL